MQAFWQALAKRPMHGAPAYGARRALQLAAHGMQYFAVPAVAVTLWYKIQVAAGIDPWKSNPWQLYATFSQKQEIAAAKRAAEDAADEAEVAAIIAAAKDKK
eukprot:tig00000157_g9602.t1